MDHMSSRKTSFCESSSKNQGMGIDILSELPANLSGPDFKTHMSG